MKQLQELPTTQSHTATGQTPQAIPEVVVLSITYAPAQNQIIGIDPHYPRQMSADDVIHILRSAERTIIETITAQKLALNQGT